jgi:DNA-binding NtrC family response regulator
MEENDLIDRHAIMKEPPVTKTAQEYPVETMAFHASWHCEAPKDRLQPPRGTENPAEFLADLAERIAAACVDSRCSSTAIFDGAMPLPQQTTGDDYVRVMTMPRVAASAVNADIELFTADGHMRQLEHIQADVIRLAVRLYQGRISEVARRLNIGRSTLYRKLDEYGIDYRP